MMRVCLCGAPKTVHTAPGGGCTWCSCDEYEEDMRPTVPDDEWMWLPERGYFR